MEREIALAYVLFPLDMHVGALDIPKTDYSTKYISNHNNEKRICQAWFVCVRRYFFTIGLPRAERWRRRRARPAPSRALRRRRPSLGSACPRLLPARRGSSCPAPCGLVTVCMCWGGGEKRHRVMVIVNMWLCWGGIVGQLGSPRYVEQCRQRWYHAPVCRASSVYMYVAGNAPTQRSWPQGGCFCASARR